MPDEITADIDGLRSLSTKLGLVADDVGAVVRRVDRVPEPTVDVYGGEPAVGAMSRLLSSWAGELGLLQQVCTMMSEAAENTADDWQNSEEQIADSFDLLQWPPGPDGPGQ